MKELACNDAGYVFGGGSCLCIPTSTNKEVIFKQPEKYKNRPVPYRVCMGWCCNLPINDLGEHNKGRWKGEWFQCYYQSRKNQRTEEL